MLQFFNDYSTKLQLEKLVIGLEEPILIKGVGEFVAKIDSGNGGYNVIHGQNPVQQGDIITFATYNHKDERKMVSKKIKEFIKVNIGSGNIEERPVIELDVKFAGDLYKKIPFSIANRSSNTHKILICKDFVQNELDALIDVGGSNITTNKVEVEYVKEATEEPGLGQKAAHNTKKFLKGFLANMQSIGNSVGGSTIGGVSPLQVNDKKKAKSLFDDYKDKPAKDADLIRKQCISELKPSSFNIDSEKLKKEDILCFKLVDFTGKYWGSGDKVVPSEQPFFDQYQKLLNGKQEKPAQNTPNNQQQQKPEQKNNNPNNQQQNPVQKNESFSEKVRRLILEAENAAQQPNANQNLPNQQQNNANPSQNNQNNATQQPGKLADLQKRYDLRNKFFIYYVEIGENISTDKSSKEKTINEQFSKINLSSIADTLFSNLGNQSVTYKTPAVTTFISQMTEKLNGAGLSGTFAFCYELKGVEHCTLLSENIVKNEGKSEEGDDDSSEEDNKEDTNQENLSIEDQYNQIISQWKNNPILKYINFDPNENLLKDESKLNRTINILNSIK